MSLSQRAAAAAPSGKRALIAVDLQNDFISGSLSVDKGERSAQRMAELMRNAKAAGYDHVISTQDWHIDPGSHWAAEGTEPDYKDTWPVHCKAGTWGADLHDAVKDLPVDERFFKGHNSPGYSGFEGISGSDNTSMSDWLHGHGIQHVDVAGIATDKCVHATARDAAGAGFHTRVLPHYSAPVTDEGERDALNDLSTNHGVEIANGPVGGTPKPLPQLTAIRRRGGILTMSERLR